MACDNKKYKGRLSLHLRRVAVKAVIVFMVLCIQAIYCAAEVTVNTDKLTITGGTPPAPPPPFPPVTVNTGVLTITGGMPPPPAPAFPPVNITTDKLTITGKTKQE